MILFAPLDVLLSPQEARQPDIVLVHRKRMHMKRMNILKKRGVEGTPDLVAEIVEKIPPLPDE